MKLSNTQKKAISILASSPLAENFYWTGGTLLSYYYLNHRNSLDLDFFSEKEFVFDEVNQLAKKIKNEIGFEKINFKKIFDRFEFIFENSEILRIEFVYYNHEKKTLKKRSKLLGLYIDSLEDIAANKVMAYFDRNEPKDLFDLYFILIKKDFSVQKLLELAHQKFGVEFTESLFWSEAFKSLSLLHTLKPLIEKQSDQEKENLIREIERYFKDGSSTFLNEFIS